MQLKNSPLVLGMNKGLKCLASQVVVGEQLGLSSFFILVVKYVCGSLDLLLAPLLIILLNQEVRLGLGVLYRSVYTGSLDLLHALSSLCRSVQYVQGPWTSSTPSPHSTGQFSMYRVPGPPPRPLLTLPVSSVCTGSLDLLHALSSLYRSVQYVHFLYRVPEPPPRPLLTLQVSSVCTGSLELLLAPLLIILLNQEVRLGLGVLYRSVHTGSLDLPLTPSSSFCSTRRYRVPGPPSSPRLSILFGGRIGSTQSKYNILVYIVHV
jgi:hypothetical protein